MIKCRMIISSVKSLLEEPDLQETETQSMVAVPIPSAENTFLDLNASVTFEDESSIPQSPVDANLNEDSNAFESVYVPLPVDLYENEGTREGSISCQDQDLSKTEHPTGIRCCDEKGNYLVELSPVKLVNVDQILKSSKPGENMKQDIQTQGTDVVNPSAVAAGEESQKTENGANRRRSFRKRTRPNLLYVADEVTNYLYQRKYRKRNWAQWNNKVSAHLLKTMSSSQVTKHTDQESTMETEIADSSISMSEKTIKSEPSVSKTKLNRIGQKRGRKRKNAVITVKTDSSVSIPEKSIKNEPYVSEEELKTGQKKVQKKHLEKNTVKAENTSSVSIPEENIKSEPSVSNAVTKPYSNAKLKTLQKPKAHGGKPNFKCEQCGKKYYYLRGLRQHLRLECNIPPQFPCPYCPAQYRYRHAIKDHVNSKHPMAYPKWYVNHFVLQPNSANPK
ncbi:uncharacterized protein LOC129002337 isoform X1 [Macrosteles quadrilineatus]|uniref:uncharacterized protein LOC129002337 isoform X1 n=1 Tax=Macrosteles quadrilineatus TaxID=74068 RepID=UPI0023E21C25|nr:uncharacterized protein LOC129002337 isoform X1 [Macrosteles quadrilineatus]